MSYARDREPITIFLPKGGTIIARVSRHLTTMIDGVIHDTHDCSRNGTRCVYGYFHRP